jgi:hypothetical protein
VVKRIKGLKLLIIDSPPPECDYRGFYVSVASIFSNINEYMLLEIIYNSAAIRAP